MRILREILFCMLHVASVAETPFEKAKGTLNVTEGKDFKQSCMGLL